MAKAIIVYALVAAPVIWLVSLFTLSPLPDHALVAFVEGTVNLVTATGEFLVLVSLAVGGWKLRALQTSAPTWLKCSALVPLGLDCPRDRRPSLGRRAGGRTTAERSRNAAERRRWLAAGNRLGFHSLRDQRAGLAASARGIAEVVLHVRPGRPRSARYVGDLIREGAEVARPVSCSGRPGSSSWARLDW